MTSTFFILLSLLKRFVSLKTKTEQRERMLTLSCRLVHKNAHLKLGAFGILRRFGLLLRLLGLFRLRLLGFLRLNGLRLFRLYCGLWYRRLIIDLRDTRYCTIRRVLMPTS